MDELYQQLQVETKAKVRSFEGHIVLIFAQILKELLNWHGIHLYLLSHQHRSPPRVC